MKELDKAITRLIKKYGPLTAKEVSEGLNETGLAWIQVMDDRSPIGERIVARIMDDSNRFVRDGDGRWHMRAVDEEAHL